MKGAIAMQITVLVEPMNGQGFRATGCVPFGISVEAATREEALKKLQGEVQARMKSGAEIVLLNVPAESNPWLKIAGMYKDEPMFEEWQEAIADYRDQIEKDDNYR
jgi:hypothetical protein